MAQVIAAGASANVKADYPCEVNIRRVKEPPEVCVGSAAGIVLAVQFTEGCVLGADALLQKSKFNRVNICLELSQVLAYNAIIAEVIELYTRSVWFLSNHTVLQIC